LYYARAVDPIVLMPLNDIATGKTKAAERTQAATNQLLDYFGDSPRRHHQVSCFRYHIKHPQRCLSNEHSRLGGLFFCGDKSPHEDNINGSILNVASVIKNVVASAAESEVGVCFQNAQSGAPLRVKLTELGHIQPPIPLRTDKSKAFGNFNETIKQKRSKAMDTRYH
jgi:hypothetical protein